MLDERKLKILEAIIDSYINLAEPVGSRTLSKKYDLGISSATIRNEMSDLEELGFLNKPHASAGRVPSDKAYRLYVDTLLESNLVLNEELLSQFKDKLVENVNEFDDILYNASKLLSQITSYTSITISPVSVDTTIKMLKLMKIDVHNIMIVIVGNQGDVENYIFYSKDEKLDDDIDQISNILNNMISEKTLEEIEGVEIMLSQYETDRELIQFALNSAKRFLNKHYDYEIYSSGIANVVNYMEYGDMDNVKNFFDFFEDKDNLIDVVIGNLYDDLVDIRIGSENTIEPMKDYSVVSAKYNMGGNTFGNISIIGPKRMDYAQLIKILMMFSKNLSDLSGFL